MMLENVTFTEEAGTIAKHDVVVFALSTCGFCKSCLKFLHDKGVKFKYVYYDLLDTDVKAAVKDELTKKYNERIMFPFVVIDDGKHVVVGFKEDQLVEFLGLK
ncbi:MAG: glutaredoxin family protein [Candidatus Lokiarchaeota archaeon]|nr:glutaredoxin family protein [Candidatus Lokiarchaeota archaeon]